MPVRVFVLPGTPPSQSAEKLRSGRCEAIACRRPRRVAGERRRDLRRRSRSGHSRLACGQLYDRGPNHQRLEPPVLRRAGHHRNAWHQPLSARSNPQTARARIDAERRRDHLSDLQNLSHPTRQISGHVVGADRLRHLVLPARFQRRSRSAARGGVLDQLRRHRGLCPFVLDRGHGRIVCGGMVRHTGQYICQSPDGLRLAQALLREGRRPSPRFAASLGTSSIFPCARGCRSAYF